MSETLYLETDFLQFDIEEITYDEYDVKIENAEIFIDFIEIKKNFWKNILVANMILVYLGNFGIGKMKVNMIKKTVLKYVRAK